ncbi:MAG: acyl carrier protein [Maricaulaceae bacterium]
MNGAQAAADPGDGQVLRVVSEALERFRRPDQSVRPDTDIMADLDIDSVAVMDVMMELEDTFDISVPLEVIPRIRTVADLAAEIEAIRSEGR